MTYAGQLVAVMDVNYDSPFSWSGLFFSTLKKPTMHILN